MAVPLLIAHRGYPRHYPENSLTGIEAALDAGARYVECDVQLSADLVPVVCHDPDLARTGGQPRSILDSPWAELARATVGEPERFGTTFATETLPTLAEVVATVIRRPGVTGLVELKTESVDRYGAACLASRVMEVLGGHRDRFILISFSAAAVMAARAAGATRVGWVLTRWDDAARLQAATLAPDLLICNYTKLPATPLWSGPWQWALYEIDAADLALDLGERGAAFVETYSIGELLRDPRLHAANAADAGTP